MTRQGYSGGWDSGFRPRAPKILSVAFAMGGTLVAGFLRFAVSGKWPSVTNYPSTTKYPTGA